MSELPSDVDPECRPLCEALNRLPGIRTTCSCCGHGKEPFMVFFDTRRWSALPPVAYYLSACHCGFAGWRLIAKTDCSMAPISFMIEGPAGAFEQANAIAELIVGYVEGRART